MTLSDYEDQVHSEEQSKLDEVIQYITMRRLHLRRQMPATAGDQRAANSLQEMMEREDRNLSVALEQPYFGRVDYSLNTDDTEDDSDLERVVLKTVYVTGIEIPALITADTDVVTWTNPVAGLYYTTSMEDGYTAPRGHVPARVNLKRFLNIRVDKLEDFTDVFRRHIPAADRQKLNMLTETLSGTGDRSGHLQIIVETIEPEQYASIANVSDKVLIVQGAAGSGKSEIGLHRIAYLLSPHNGIAEADKPTPNTTLFIGPSKAFLQYVADILPGLGVEENVEQTRFSDWLMSQFSDRIRVKASIWSDLLTNGTMTRFNEEAETLKGSLAMADAIERHVKGLVNDTRRRIRRFHTLVDERDSRIRISKDEISRIANEVLRGANHSVHLNQRRENFINQITNIAFNRGQHSARFRNVRPQQIRDELRNRLVEPWCNAHWKHLDFKQEYVSLLSDSENMVQQAKGALAPDSAREMAGAIQRRLTDGFDDSDLGALAYMDHLLNGTVRSNYRHIVVDEAQDISPIEFKLLSVASSNKWFTVLGDTAQRLTPYRGIRTWKRDLMRIFGLSDIEVQPARKSYRSTRQITTFNNRILRTFDQNIDAPIPFEREGHRVEYHRHRTARDMYGAVTADVKRIRSMDGLENAVIAILARDQRNMNEFQKFYEGEGVHDITPIGQDHYSSSRTVLARIPDVKGLEYDAVIVMGVNESFSDTTFNKKLLYIATTRAKHYLSIHWSGQQSLILKEISDRGITLNDFTRRPPASRR